MNITKVVTNGTAAGTHVKVSDGVNEDHLAGVHAIRREGRNTFITVRVRDLTLDVDESVDAITDMILHGDWALAIKPQPALKAGELLTPVRAWA